MDNSWSICLSASVTSDDTTAQVSTTLPGLQTGKRKQVWKRRDLKNEDVIVHYGEARETDIVIPCV
jgi:hypothetical protein